MSFQGLVHVAQSLKDAHPGKSSRAQHLGFFQDLKDFPFRGGWEDEGTPIPYIECRSSNLSLVSPRYMKFKIVLSSVLIM